MNIAIAQADADALTDILARAGMDTNGPGWGPTTIKRLGEFADAAEAGQVQITGASGAQSPAQSAPGTFADLLATIAEGQIGTQEDTAHTNRGSAILKYQQATSLKGQGWPWCAAFVDWCFQTASITASAPAARPRSTLERPETASAFGLIDWAHEQGLPVFTSAQGKPQRGDIVVYTFSHTGIVTGYARGSGLVAASTFATVEGNTNDQGGADGYEVARRNRPFSQVKAFIRVA